MKKIEIFLKNVLLRVLLLLKSGRSRHNGPVSFNENSKLLFIRLNRIGDALVTTPLIQEVKRQLKCRIFVLADRKNSFVFTNNPNVDEVIVFRKGFKGFLEVLSLIKLDNFDAIIDLHDDVSTTVTYLLAMAKAPNKFGLKKGNEIVYTKTVEKPDPSKFHVIDRLMSLVSLFGISYCKEEINVGYFPKPVAIDKAGEVLKRRFPGKKFLLGINISAGSQARFWGVERYRELIGFLESYDIYVLLLCSVNEAPQALEITRGKEDNIFYSPSFDEFASMISKLDMLFTPDTMAVHLASAFMVPVFGIYVHFNTKDMIWTPYRSDFECVITENNTLSEVTFNQVIQKFKPFLEKYIS
jgi:ADP-heptose:LPS heptosyltransferase